MGETHTLTITGGIPGTGQLTINNGVHVRAAPSDKIIWEIAPNPQVRAILDIQPKEGSDGIFSDGPKRISDILWEATIDPNISSLCSVFNYSIKWRANGGLTPTHDPIISVKPSLVLTKNNFNKYNGTILGTLGGGLISFILWRMDRMNYKRENDRLERENKRLENELNGRKTLE